MKKVLVIVTVILGVAISPLQNVKASGNGTVIQVAREIAGVQRADVIVRKYRMFNGVLQYRRWNETRGYWVDPDWIDID